LYRFKLLN